MEVKGAYYNTKYQVSALESLAAKLPDLNSPAAPSSRWKAPRRARHLDERDVQRLIESYRSGLTVYELADRFGIGRNTVCKILHRNNVPMRNRRLSADEISGAILLYSEGCSPPQIGQRLGVSAATVRRRLRERGITLRCAPEG